jgi:hypothetical protein
VVLFFFYTLSIGVLPEKVNKKEFLTADVTDIGKKEKPHAKTRRREGKKQKIISRELPLKKEKL